LLTRRRVLKGLGATLAAGIGMTGYAFGIEPRFRLVTTRYRVLPPQWPRSLKLKLALITDLHAGEPFMPPARIAEIVARANAEQPDLILLLGDFVKGHNWETRMIPAAEWAQILAGLKAPLGVHAVLGNHDWWDDRAVQRLGRGPTEAHRAFAANGIPVYDNTAVRLTKAGQPFWLAGLGDQLALLPGFGSGRRRVVGVDDLPATLAQITDAAPVILMAHEPDIFPRVPARVALTVSGHTHGGQVRVFGYAPMVPSRFGNRFGYGHVVEDNRHLVVSGGLGCSIMPVRFGVPPEVVIIDVG
jgi:uncharacterized protein